MIHLKKLTLADKRRKINDSEVNILNMKQNRKKRRKR